MLYGFKWQLWLILFNELEYSLFSGYGYVDIETECYMESQKFKPNTQECKSIPLVCGGLEEGTQYVFGLSAIVTDVDENILDSGVSVDKITHFD